MRWVKSLRNGVHHANAVVWEPVYTFEDVARVRAAVHEVELREHAHGRSKFGSTSRAMRTPSDVAMSAFAGDTATMTTFAGAMNAARHVLDLSHDRRRLRVVPYKATSGRS